MNYYTLQVILCNEKKLTWKNLTDAQIDETKKTIWQQGIKEKINHMTFELHSPFVIQKVIIHVQTEFINELQ